MRYLKLILLLMVVSVSVLLSARLLGRLRPASIFDIIRSRPDGTSCERLCLFGIEPGVTSMQQAVLMLHAHPLTHDAKWITDNTLRLAGPEAYVAFSATPDGLVDSIALTDNLNDTGIPVPDSLADSIMLGDIISVFGAPKTLGLPGSDYVVVNYVEAGILAALARPINFNIRLRPETPISILMVSTYGPCPPAPIIAMDRSWRGFTTLFRYYRDLPKIEFGSRSSGVPLPPYSACRK